MFRSGYWVLGPVRGAWLKLHWSIVLGAFVFGGWRLNLGFLVLFPCLILVHELGHAFIAVRLGHRVVSIEATGLGGACQWSGNASPFEEALIAWGGVLAQLLLFLGTKLLLALSSGPSSTFAWQAVSVFTHTNLYLMAVNLLPIAPLDGARAWTLFSAWRDRGTRGIPYGTWRDPSRHAQRAWFDTLRKQPDPGEPRQNPARAANEREARAANEREARAANEREVRAAPDAPDASEGALDSETQRTIDELLRRATGKDRTPHRRDP